jgi:hypothetical protein
MLEAGEFEAALPVGAHAVERSVARLGTAHPLTALARRVQGWIELSNGRAADAIGRFRTNLALHEAKLGARSRSMVDDRVGLTFALLAQGHQDEALVLGQQAWEFANELYGSVNRTTIDAGLALMGVHVARGELAAAQGLLEDLQQRLRGSGRRLSRQYLHVSRELGKVRDARGLRAEAAAVRADCRAAGTEAFGPAHSLTVRCAEVLEAVPAPPSVPPER